MVTCYDTMPAPSSERYGFDREFGAEDDEEESDEDEEEENEEVIWEYNAGTRGHPDWRRYPRYINRSIEEMHQFGGPRYMYEPGCRESEGNSEREMSRNPPPMVATNYVYYSAMLEYDIYKGAARVVRRNGSQDPPPAPKNPLLF